jgi:hypothetical protein
VGFVLGIDRVNDFSMHSVPIHRNWADHDQEYGAIDYRACEVVIPALASVNPFVVPHPEPLFMKPADHLENFGGVRVGIRNEYVWIGSVVCGNWGNWGAWDHVVILD